MNKHETEAAPGNTEVQPARKRSWLKKLGVAGFMFFLIKGLLWIVAFYGGFRLLGCNG